MLKSVKFETGTDQLICEIIDKIGVITLNQPEKRNALGEILTPALRKTLSMLEDKEEVAVIIITGSGDAFCSGGDIKQMGRNTEEYGSISERIRELIKRQNELTLRLFNLKKPTIAMISGPAAGAGFCIALACDFRMASDDAFFSTGYRNVGLPGDYGGTWLLTRLVGAAKTKEFYFTAEKITAKKAFDLGIVSKLSTKDKLRMLTFDFAKLIANAPVNAIISMKKNINFSLTSSLEETLKLEAADTVLALNSEEHKIALRDFILNRPDKKKE